MSALGDILCDSWGVVLATFGSFLGHRLIFHVDFMAICEGIELVVQLGHSVVEIESDSATMVSWILSRAHVCRDYTDALHHIRASKGYFCCWLLDHLSLHLLGLSAFFGSSGHSYWFT